MDNLLRKWSTFVFENNDEALSEFLDEFIKVYSRFYDPDFLNLSNESTEESPHLTQHPEAILEKLGLQLKRCRLQIVTKLSADGVKQAADILKCLVIICRNYDNVMLVSSCEFVNSAIASAQAVLTKLCSSSEESLSASDACDWESFVHSVIHFLECLYDPYFVWRRRLKGWDVDVSHQHFKPALVHSEVIPFVYDCFQKPRLSSKLQLRLLHLFGALMSGSSTNATLAVNPASLTIILSILSGTAACCVDVPEEEHRNTQRIVLLCLTRLVHALHTGSPDQRQVEVPEVIEGVVSVLLGQKGKKPSSKLLIDMIGAFPELVKCPDKLALQVQLGTDRTFEGLISALKSASDSPDAQDLAKCVVEALRALLSSSATCKASFEKSVGYQELLDVLRLCGQPSESLLQALMNLVVEEDYSESRTGAVRNPKVAVMMLSWLDSIKAPVIQVWLSEELRKLCTYSYGNRMSSCSAGMLSMVLTLLAKHSQLQFKTVGHLICLLEKLGSLSVKSSELKQLICLMKPEEDGRQFPYTTRLMRAISTMARRDGSCGPLHFFDIQHLSDCISLPGVRRWPGPAFSFFSWVCLDMSICLDSYEDVAVNGVFRRMLYSFSSSGGNGFEAFFTPAFNLTVATFSKKDFSTVTVTDLALADGLWHSVCVVHVPGRRFVNSPGHVSVYIDGKQKMNTALKFPTVTEPFSQCRVGSPGARLITEAQNELFVNSNVEIKKRSTFKSLFSFAVGGARGSENNYHTPGVHTLISGTQDDTWGPLICLHGQLESVCVFQDILQPDQVKTLSDIGPNSLFHFSDDAIIADLNSKLIARYSGKACKGHVCADLSPCQNHGMFSGNSCYNWDIKDVINCLGGIQVLFPLLENLDQSIPILPGDDEESPGSPLREEAEELDLEDWVITNNRTSSELRLEYNQLAAFITMLRYMLKEKTVNRDIFVRTHCAATLGILMQKASSDLMDVNVLMAVQHLVEDCDERTGPKPTLLQHVYHYILFDFSLWSRTQFAVRIGHIQYLSTIIKDDRKYFRKKYGVQFFLDVIRTYYSTTEDSLLGAEDSKMIRVSLLNLIKYYIIKDITSDELSQLTSFMLAVREPTLLLEAMDLLISLLDSRSRRQDQLILLLYEPEQAELFYQLLTYPSQPIIFYEKVVKVLYLLLKSERVYEKSKSRLRLAEVGHWGLVNLMSSYDISAPMIKRFMEQVSFTETAQMYRAVLAILSLVHNCGLDIKSEASRQLLALIVSKIGAAKGFAKQLGWQENITRLLTLERRRTFSTVSSDNISSTSGVSDLSSVPPSLAQQQQQNQQQQQQTQDDSSDSNNISGSTQSGVAAEEGEGDMPPAASLSPPSQLSTSPFTSMSSPLSVSSPASAMPHPEVRSSDSGALSSPGVSSSSAIPSTSLNVPAAQGQPAQTVNSSFISAGESTSKAAGTASPSRPSALAIPRSSTSPDHEPVSTDISNIDSVGGGSGCGGLEEGASVNTPHTPFYLRRGSNIFEELSTPDGEEAPELTEGSRSSSASVEDLLRNSPANVSSDSLSGLVSSSASNISISSSVRTESSVDGGDSALGNSHTSVNTLGNSQRPSEDLGSSKMPDVFRRQSSSDILDGHDGERRISSVLKGEGFKQVLDHVGVELADTLEQKEELCQNVLIVLLSIMWKGLEGSSPEFWKERCQVFTWIDELGESHLLIRPPEEVKRRLMEMLLHNCCTDIRNAGQAIASQSENAIELIRLVQSFVTGADASLDRFSIRLLEDVWSLLDVLGVWDTESGLAWTEMVHRGISLLLAFSRQSDLMLVSAATVKLHALVQTKLISSSAEASYILGVLNSMIIKAIEANSDNYAYLMTVLRALIDKGQELLTISVHLPHLPQTSMSPTFFDDFKTYAYSEEWQQFIKNYIAPQMSHFMESNFEEGVMSMSQFWADCHEDMMMNHHRHNREIGESRLKYKKNIEEAYKKKVEQENRRFQNGLTQHKHQLLFAMRQWRATRRFFTGERGIWRDSEHEELVHWKLSYQENFARMKVKLTQNYNFEDHVNASVLRDNGGVVETNKSLRLEELSAVKGALVSQENMADDSLGDEEWSVISASSTNLEAYTGKEKLIISADCVLITVMDEVRGRLELTNTHLYFFDCSPHRDEVGEDFKWALGRLREIHFRRYNLRRSALEIFLIDQTNYFINFSEKRMRNKIYSNILSLRPQNLIYKGQRSPADLLRASGLTQKWVNREISNFEYLMQLNTIAGRTYNDLSQYPVFPWILTDYTSKHLDLENPAVFRDLSRPIGIVNPRNEDEVREKYDTFEDPSGMIEKFHYGTHYSNAASVMHYLVRVEPFTSLHIELQSGKFDVADRQFHSIPGSFASLMENPNDVKELIPEFFYFPEFLVNFNGFDLGKLQITKEPVNDVKLPPWASTPEEFIYKHRQALESEYVSSQLHNWIDLIFGYKQKGPAAAEALNVFYYVTYEGAVDLDAIQDPKERASVEGMIRNFGQTPSQLLKEPHPHRLTFDEAVARTAKSLKPMSVFYFLKDLKPFFVEVSNDLDPLVYVNIPRSQPRSILQQGMPDSLISVTEDGVIGIHGWLSYDKSIPNFYTFDKDATMLSAKTKRRLAAPFSPGLRVSAKLFVVSHDAKLLFSAGYWDNSLQVYSLGRPKLINHIIRHIDIVTCLALDNCGRHLVTGSRDTTCMVWEIVQQAGVSVNLNPKPLQTLYGHDSEVTAVHISTELDLVVSASKDGTVILHTVLKGHYTMTLRAPGQLGWTVDIPLMAVSDTGQIVLYCLENEKQTGEGRNKVQERHCLHLYSVNGKHLFSEPLTHTLGDMCMSGDHLILGNTSGQLIIMDIFSLRPITTMELLVPIQCLTVANNNSHILVGLKDGKLIIVGNKGKS
ncbi:neurobeachin-like protein 1 [Aplysia californica]|uniref:Neurobeachin-like protein 1 n=1 Tax=Aplysia californica TaxID=6500 RepID=A0ABM0ZWQ8_APLCA|nr:neurobeachin-like protein 1 [Aplysia californica]